MTVLVEKDIMLDTFLVGGINTFPHLFFAVGIHIHIREDSSLVGPQVVVGAKEVNGELPDIVPHPLDVLWDCLGMADLCGPPPLQSRRGTKQQRLTAQQSIWGWIMYLSLPDLCLCWRFGKGGKVVGRD